MAKPTSPSSTNTVSLSQQAINIARQILSTKGWAVTLDDIYQGGKMLSEVLPELDLSWVKDAQEVAAMKPAAKAAYLKRDEEWVARKVEFVLTDKQKEVFKRAFAKVAESGNLAPHPAMTELITTLGLVDQG